MYTYITLMWTVFFTMHTPSAVPILSKILNINTLFKSKNLFISFKVMNIFHALPSCMANLHTPKMRVHLYSQLYGNTDDFYKSQRLLNTGTWCPLVFKKCTYMTTSERKSFIFKHFSTPFNRNTNKCFCFPRYIFH